MLSLHKRGGNTGMDFKSTKVELMKTKAPIHVVQAGLNKSNEYAFLG